MKKVKTRVVHSESKTAWNVVGTTPGDKYKIARVPYITIDESDILSTMNKNEALEHALFISDAFNKEYSK